MHKRFQIIFPIVSLLLVFIFYFLLQPRLSNVFPFIREYRLTSFIQNTIRNNHISSQEFWQLREFYSPGAIQFDKRNLTFISDRVISQESLVDKKMRLHSLTPSKENWRILHSNESELIATDGKYTFIYFIKPISEMAEANGFFDYRDKDKKLLEGKNWYVETKIRK